MSKSKSGSKKKKQKKSRRPKTGSQTKASKRKPRTPSNEPETKAAQVDAAVQDGRWREAANKEKRQSWLRQVAEKLGNRAVLRLMNEADGREEGDLKEAADEPTRVLGQLDEGRPLEANVRREMEAGLGEPLDDVRIHTDAEAAQLAEEQDALAFTVGQHIVFDHGEYQPGTLEGKALIAHELAHTIQQKDAQPGQTAESVEAEASLEADANRAVAGVARRRFGTVQRALADFPRLAGARMRSGLRIARCISKPKTSEEKYNAVKDTLSKAETGFKSAEMTLSNPEVSAKAGEVADTLGKANQAIDTVEKGVKLYGVVKAFSALDDVDPQEDPQAFAKAAGQAVASAGEIMKMSKIPGVSMYGEFLSNAGNFFENMRLKLDPSERWKDRPEAKYLP
jgi:hypothetical protein